LLLLVVYERSWVPIACSQYSSWSNSYAPIATLWMCWFNITLYTKNACSVFRETRCMDEIKVCIINIFLHLFFCLQLLYTVLPSPKWIYTFCT
jgi:hypothetical protein